MANGTVPFMLHANFVGTVNHQNTTNFNSHQISGIVIEKGSSFPEKPTSGSLVNGRLFYYTPANPSDGDGKGQGLCEYKHDKRNEAQQDFVANGVELAGALHGSGWFRVGASTTATGLKMRPVRVKTTAAVTLSAIVAGSVVDGVTLAENDRVFVNTQGGVDANGNDLPHAANGPYVVTSSGLVRTADGDEWDEFINMMVVVAEGTVNANTLWSCTADTGGTLDTTALFFFGLELGVMYSCTQLTHEDLATDEYRPFSHTADNVFKFNPLWTESAGVTFLNTNNGNGDPIHTQLIVTPTSFGIPYLALNKEPTIQNAYKPFADQDSSTFYFAPLVADNDITFTEKRDTSGKVTQIEATVNFPAYPTQELVTKFAFPQAPMSANSYATVSHSYGHNLLDVKFYERVGASAPYLNNTAATTVSPIEMDFEVTNSVIKIYSPIAIAAGDMYKYIVVMKGIPE